MAEQAFRLGVLESVLKTRLAQKLPGIRKDFPVDVLVGHSKGLAAKLEAGELDAVFAIGVLEMPPGIERARAFAENVMLIYPGAHAAVTSPAGLKGMPLAALAEGCAYRKRAIDWFESDGARPLVIQDQPDYSGVLNAVADGQGFAAVPESVLSRFSRKAEIQAGRLQGEGGQVWVELLWRRDAPRAVIERIREAMGF